MYIGEFEAVERQSEKAEIHTAVRSDEVGNLIFEPGRQYVTEIMPAEMADDRTVTDYSEIIFERNGRAILAKDAWYWELEDGEHITFL